MSEDLGFTCSRCGERHSSTPLSYATAAPDYWTPDLAADPQSGLTADQCVIKEEHFFVHGLIEIPVIDTADTFAWGVWVSLSRDSFEHATVRWNEPGRENDEPRFGWLSTALAPYSPTTIQLKTMVHTRPVGERPFVELEPTDHPLAVEQRTGITRDRVRQIAEQLLHLGEQLT